MATPKANGAAMPAVLRSAIQGATFAPYLREGRRADARNLQLFNALLQGDSALYVAMLN